MTAAWTSEAVADCLQTVRLPRSGKLQTRDYQDAGAHPIIDQGQMPIAGWTDSAEGLIAEQLPVVVFGDHSRTFKYVDFPFVRGADGTQILKPRSDIDARYFYYACRSLDLASRGYNRHFSLLKEQTIPVPPPEDQVRIAQALQQVEQYVRLQNVQLAATRALKRATSARVFARGLRDSAIRDGDLGSFPQGWETVAIGQLGRVVTGTTPPTKERANYAEGSMPFIAPGDFKDGDRIVDTDKKLSDRGLAVSRPVPEGTTCFVCIGSTIGKVGITTAPVSATNQQINAVVASAEYDPKFVFHLLTHWSEHVQRHASPSPVPILSKGAFERIMVVSSTDPSEQREIADVLDAVDDRIAILSAKAVLGERLLTVLTRRLIHREVRVEDLKLGLLPAAEGDAA